MGRVDPPEVLQVRHTLDVEAGVAVYPVNTSSSAHISITGPELMPFHHAIVTGLATSRGHFRMPNRGHFNLPKSLSLFVLRIGSRAAVTGGLDGLVVSSSFVLPGVRARGGVVRPAIASVCKPADRRHGVDGG
jgi:hypothetical protein